jgi:hypothetical protein
MNDLCVLDFDGTARLPASASKSWPARIDEGS